jgi:hypothetical protein
MGDSRTLQAGGDPVLVYAAADVAKLVITAFVKQGEAFVPMNAAGQATAEDAADRLKLETTTERRYLVLKNLLPDRTYRFQARAYDAQDNLISKDEGSTTDVTFVRTERMSTTDISLQLADKPFAGTARATLAFPDGLNGTDHVLLSLFKKGPPEEQVAGPIQVESAEFGRTLVLGGLAPDTTYVLRASARDAADKELTAAAIEWAVGTDQALGSKPLALGFEAEVSTISGGESGSVSDVPLADARYSLPRGMTQGEAPGIVYLAESKSIRRLDLNGNVTTRMQDPSITQLLGVTRASNGNLFAINSSKLFQITSTDVHDWGSAPKGAGVSMGPDGHVYVTTWNTLDYSPGHSPEPAPILRFTGSGVSTAVVTEPASSLWGLQVDASGNLYAVDNYNHRILKFTKNNHTYEREVLLDFRSTGPMDGLASEVRLSDPLSIALSGDSLYFTDLGYVRRLKDGTVKTLAGGGAPVGGNLYPDGKGSAAGFGYYLGGLLVLPNNGGILVSDTINHRIRKIVLPPSLAD